MADTKVDLKPAPGYLLIKPEDAESATASGILLPDTVGEKPQSGTVLGVGDEEVLGQGGKKGSPVKVGERVIYKKWGGNDFKIDSEEFMFVKFDDILAIYHKAK